MVRAAYHQSLLVHSCWLPPITDFGLQDHANRPRRQHETDHHHRALQEVELLGGSLASWSRFTILATLFLLYQVIKPTGVLLQPSMESRKLFLHDLPGLQGMYWWCQSIVQVHFGVTTLNARLVPEADRPATCSRSGQHFDAAEVSQNCTSPRRVGCTP